MMTQMTRTLDVGNLTALERALEASKFRDRRHLVLIASDDPDWVLYVLCPL